MALNDHNRPKLFPTRTLLLMLAALIAFARLYWITHRPAPPAVNVKTVEIELQPTDAGPFDGGAP